MERRALALCLVLIPLLGHALGFQEKTPLQPGLVQVPTQGRGNEAQVQQQPQQQPQTLPQQPQPPQQLLGVSVEEGLGSQRGIEDQLLKSIGKAGFKYFGSSGSTTTTPKPTVQHQHHYYYSSEDNQHPRQYGHHHHPPPPPSPPRYPWPGYPQPQPPYRPWQPPYNQWPYGWGHWGGGGYPGYPGYPRYPSYPGYPGYPNYPGYPSYPGYPYYPFYRSAENEETDDIVVPQPELNQRSIPGSYQARVLASNLVSGKANGNVLPLYQLLNVARV